MLDGQGQKSFLLIIMVKADDELRRVYLQIDVMRLHQAPCDHDMTAE